MGAGLHGGFGNTKGFQANNVPTKNVSVIKKTSPNKNIKRLSKKYQFDKTTGKFGIKDKNCQIIVSKNPIKDSKKFYKKISRGGLESMLPENKGYKVFFTDDTIIVYRVITKTKDSPAIDIKVVNKSEGGISSQKIHFVKENKNAKN